MVDFLDYLLWKKICLWYLIKYPPPIRKSDSFGRMCRLQPPASSSSITWSNALHLFAEGYCKSSLQLLLLLPLPYYSLLSREQLEWPLTLQRAHSPPLLKILQHLPIHWEQRLKSFQCTQSLLISLTSYVCAPPSFQPHSLLFFWDTRHIPHWQHSPCCLPLSGTLLFRYSPSILCSNIIFFMRPMSILLNIAAYSPTPILLLCFLHLQNLPILTYYLICLLIIYCLLTAFPY